MKSWCQRSQGKNPQSAQGLLKNLLARVLNPLCTGLFLCPQIVSAVLSFAHFLQQGFQMVLCHTTLSLKFSEDLVFVLNSKCPKKLQGNEGIFL